MKCTKTLSNRVEFTKTEVIKILRELASKEFPELKDPKITVSVSGFYDYYSYGSDHESTVSLNWSKRK